MKKSKKKSKEKINFYVEASTVIGIGKCFQKKARFDYCNDNFERSNDVEDLLQLANVAIFSDKITIPNREDYIVKIRSGTERLEKYGISNIIIKNIEKETLDEAAIDGVDRVVINLDELNGVITSKQNVTTYKVISDDVDDLMTNWHQLLCTDTETSVASGKVGRIYATVANDTDSRRKLKELANNEKLSKEDCMRLYELIKYYSNLWVAGAIGSIYTPGSSRLELAKGVARRSNKENCGINKLTEKILEKSVYNEDRSNFLPSLHKALLVRSKGTIEGVFNEALKLREKIEDVRVQFPEIWVLDNRKDFDKWVDEISGRLNDEVGKTCQSDGLSDELCGIEFDFQRHIPILGEVGIKVSGLSVSPFDRTKRKSRNYLSMLVGLAKDAGLEDDTDSLRCYRKLCKACGQR